MSQDILPLIANYSSPITQIKFYATCREFYKEMPAALKRLLSANFYCNYTFSKTNLKCLITNIPNELFCSFRLGFKNKDNKTQYFDMAECVATAGFNNYIHYELPNLEIENYSGILYYSKWQDEDFADFEYGCHGYYDGGSYYDGGCHGYYDDDDKFICQYESPEYNCRLNLPNLLKDSNLFKPNPHIAKEFGFKMTHCAYSNYFYLPADVISEYELELGTDDPIYSYPITSCIPGYHKRIEVQIILCTGPLIFTLK